MTDKDFYQMVDSFLVECIDTMKSKGQAYAGEGQDTFANFKRIADRYKIKPEFVLMVYLSKHLDAIDAYIRGEYHDPEPIHGRIKDAINYLLILFGMIKEEQGHESIL